MKDRIVMTWSWDCVPYFKTVDISAIDNIPIDMGFTMVSQSVGQTLIDNVINQDGRLQFLTYVENAGGLQSRFLAELFKVNLIP